MIIDIDKLKEEARNKAKKMVSEIDINLILKEVEIKFSEEEIETEPSY